MDMTHLGEDKKQADAMGTNTKQENEAQASTGNDQPILDLRDESRKGKLPCGAKYCHRCHEECGVIANAYILQDWNREQLE